MSSWKTFTRALTVNTDKTAWRNWEVCPSFSLLVLNLTTNREFLKSLNKCIYIKHIQWRLSSRPGSCIRLLGKSWRNFRHIFKTPSVKGTFHKSYVVLRYYSDSQLACSSTQISSIFLSFFSRFLFRSKDNFQAGVEKPAVNESKFKLKIEWYFFIKRHWTVDLSLKLWN